MSTADIVAATPNSLLGLSLWRAYEGIAEAGIRYVEVPALPLDLSVAWRQPSFAPEALGDAGSRRLVGELASMGLQPITVAAYCNILDPAHVEPLLRRIEFAETLGATHVLLDAAGADDLSAAEWRVVGTRGRFLGDFAADRGIRLAFEIHEGLTRTGASTRILLDAIDHPSVGVNYDTGNVVYYNDGVDPASDIAAVADRVLHMHLKDTSGTTREWAFGALGTGHVDLASILATVRAHGFRGPFSLEIEGYPNEDLTLAAYVERLRRSLAHLARLGVSATGEGAT